MLIATNASINRLNSGGRASLASFVRGLGPAAWFRYGVGITSALGAVSQWADQSGNARHLLQATATNQPTLEADNSITFDGVDNFMKCDPFTLAQPFTIYWLLKQITWTSSDCIFDGNTALTGAMLQSGTTPALRLFGSAGVGNNTNLALDTYGVVVGVGNGASSLTQINNTAPVTGDMGTGDPGGHTLGARGNASTFANIQAKEGILYAAAHDAATRSRVIRYLAQVGGINV